MRVAGPKGSVDIQIVDQCPIDSNPICYEGHIDLNVPAFEQIADKVTGIVPIEWQFIACGVQGNLAYHFKTGSNAYWTAVQLRNHPYAISELAYKADNDNKFGATLIGINLAAPSICEGGNLHLARHRHPRPRHHRHEHRAEPR